MHIKNVILFIGLFCIYSNYLVFNSYVYQNKLLKEASQDIFSLGNKLHHINYNYPTLALNSVPILTYLSRYDTNNNDYNSAIIKLNESLKYNPNSIYTKYLLARNYIFLNDFDNSMLILKELFEEYPQIESSSALYFAVLGNLKMFSLLQNYYKSLQEIDNKNIWSFYLSSLKTSVQTKADSLFYKKTLSYYNTNVNFD